MYLDNIIKSIDSLAPLSDVILKIQELTASGNEALDINELIALIETDSLLSVKILKMANSPMYGFSNRITSVSQAVRLFGIMQVYGFIMSDSISKNIKAKTELFGFSNERFNDICTIQNALLLQWYSKINLEGARFLAPLAFIMETGKLLIAREVSFSSYEEEFKEGFRKSHDINSYEKVLLGTTSYELSGILFEHWHLEPLYIDILREFNTQEHSSEIIAKYIGILNVVVTAVNLKSILSKNSVLEACKLVQQMGLNPEDFADVALKVKRAYISELKVRQENPES